MHNMTRATKLKLLIPVLYLITANLLFFVTFDGKPSQVIGAGIANIAFILWIIARIQLGNAFSLAPKSSFVVTSGLYSKLRHPVYYFSILAVIGLCFFVNQPPMWIALILLVVLEAQRIRKEEALLAQTFGQQYIDYKQRTWF